jgi:hypothetical protein
MSSASRASRLLYGSTIFLAAFLLFLVEPMAAKQLLPVLGGSSAVWLTCLVFFQITLLLGYMYAHWLARSGTGGWRGLMHIALLAAAVALLLFQKPLTADLSRGAANPVSTIFATLALTIGLPFLLLGSTSPLLQIWLQRRAGGSVPYGLFALSNVGSLLALAAYPTLVEPFLTLRLQKTLWTFGFIVFAVLGVILTGQAQAVPRDSFTPEHEAEAGLMSTARAKWLWFLLPMVAAMQLTAVTSHVTLNIAAIPLLWMLPLGTYLLTFIIAFEFSAFYKRGVVVRLLVLMLASLGYTLSKTDVSLPIGVAIAFFLVETFVACLFCHAEAYALRPRNARETTFFYLLVAGGGAAGTFLIAIASPLLFAANYDLAITFFLTAVLALTVTWSEGWPQRLLWSTSSVLLLALLVMLHIVNGRETMLQARNFYGTLRVKQSVSTQAVPLRTLLNGTIQHGTQLFAPGLSKTPTTYYAKDSGIGLALEHCCDGRPRNIGVVGLGAGTLAAYGRAGDRIRFYEINPLVRPVAQNLFTYLRDSPAQISFADGDARTSLTREAPQGFDVLAVDAFSGDAIPLHLLTTEAIALYRRHLAPNGIIAFHVSNQYLDLAPEIDLLASSAGMTARLVDSSSDDARGSFRATWVLVTDDESLFDRPGLDLAAEPIDPSRGLRAWTDDYSSLLPIFQLGAH